MSLRLIARDLYRFQQQVYRLEEKLANARLSDQAELKWKLTQAIAERDRLKRMLDGSLDR